MRQEEFFEIPDKVLIHGVKFVDQGINSHVSITGNLCHLITATHFYLNIIFLSPPFPSWLGLVIATIFLSPPFPSWLGLVIAIIFFFDNTLSFRPVQEHFVTLNCFMMSHPSHHLCRVVVFVACPEGCLCKVNVKMLWRL